MPSKMILPFFDIVTLYLVKWASHWSSHSCAIERRLFEKLSKRFAVAALSESPGMLRIAVFSDFSRAPFGRLTVVSVADVCFNRALKASLKA